MKKVLVTGATGFVGANLARQLLILGHEVHIFTRPSSNLWRLTDILPHLHPHSVDLQDAPAIEQTIQHIHPDWVFHLGVFGAYSYQTDINAILNTNILGTSNLVQACLKTDCEAFINTGSSSEYGYKDFAPSENTWLDPNSYYSVAKAAATHYCRYVSQKEKLPITTLRLYSVYGAYEESTRLMPTLIKQGLKGQYPPLVSPAIARDFVDIEDVIAAYLQVAQKTDLPLGEVFNIGSGVQTTLEQVITVARDILQIPEEPQWGTMADRHWDTNIWVANIDHAREVLAWKPQVDFRAGFAKMVDWFKQHEHLYPHD